MSNSSGKPCQRDYEKLISNNRIVDELHKYSRVSPSHVKKRFQKSPARRALESLRVKKKRNCEIVTDFVFKRLMGVTEYAQLLYANHIYDAKESFSEAMFVMPEFDVVSNDDQAGGGVISKIAWKLKRAVSKENTVLRRVHHLLRLRKFAQANGAVQAIAAINILLDGTEQYRGELSSLLRDKSFPNIEYIKSKLQSYRNEIYTYLSTFVKSTSEVEINYFKMKGQVVGNLICHHLATYFPTIESVTEKSNVLQEVIEIHLYQILKYLLTNTTINEDHFERPIDHMYAAMCYITGEETDNKKRALSDDKESKFAFLRFTRMHKLIFSNHSHSYYSCPVIRVNWVDAAIDSNLHDKSGEYARILSAMRPSSDKKKCPVIVKKQSKSKPSKWNWALLEYLYFYRPMIKNPRVAFEMIRPIIKNPRVGLDMVKQYIRLLKKSYTAA